MDKDLDQAKGKLKQAVGDLTDNEKLEREGKADEAGGKLKEAVSRVKDKVDDAIDDAKKKLSGS
ncbi:MAG: CsbD family protein [Actinobacteria bacterium]|nr:CsbD family protein [Actinomycetota bacterium]